MLLTRARSRLQTDQNGRLSFDEFSRLAQRLHPLLHAQDGAYEQEQEELRRQQARERELQQGNIYVQHAWTLQQLLEAQQALQHQTAEAQRWKARAETATRTLDGVAPVARSAVHGVEQVLTLLAQAKTMSDLSELSRMLFETRSELYSLMAPPDDDDALSSGLRSHRSSSSTKQGSRSRSGSRAGSTPRLPSIVTQPAARSPGRARSGAGSGAVSSAERVTAARGGSAAKSTATTPASVSSAPARSASHARSAHGPLSTDAPPDIEVRQRSKPTTKRELAFGRPVDSNDRTSVGVPRRVGVVGAS